MEPVGAIPSLGGSLATRGELARRPETRVGSRLPLSGDDTGACETLVYDDGAHVGVFRDWAELERVVGGAGLLRLDPEGCQHLVACGLVPPPRTCYAHVWSLGVGDRLELDLESGASAARVEFPYLERCSTGENRFDPRRLLALIAASVARAAPAGEPAVLLQSAGKDSTGLLLGLAEAGARHVRALTYEGGGQESEGAPAAAVARRFGFAHQVIEAEPHAECRAFLAFAERSPAVVADVALVAYLRVLEQAGVSGGVVLDGLGNDAYMGYVVPRRDAILARLSLARRFPALWGRFEAPDLGSRGSYLFKSLLMYPAERALAGSRPAPRVVRELIPHETGFDRSFARLDRRLGGLAPIDFRAWVRGRIFDGAMTLPKGRLAAAARGARAVHPWCDRELIDYVFNLERSERYDERSRRNKLALRRLLEAEVGDGPYLRRKGSFRFDVQRFVEVNEGTIREELGAARALLRGVERWGEYYLRRRRNYVHAYAATSLFMIVAWLNRRPPSVAEPLRVLE
jgi:hypothetical protein